MSSSMPKPSDRSLGFEGYNMEIKVYIVFSTLSKHNCYAFATVYFVPYVPYVPDLFF